MANVTIHKAESLRGTICAPPSKSYTQRMVLASALADGTSKICCALFSEDTKAMVQAVTALGAKVTVAKDTWEVTGSKKPHGATDPIDCGESGATLRFMIPVAALASEPSVFVLSAGLAKRPVEPLLSALKQLGVDAKVEKVGAKAFIRVSGGGILGGKVTMPGDVSSQFVSGLMFACPLAEVDTELTITSALESKSYVRMTREVLAKHGVKVDISGDFSTVRIAAGQAYKPADGHVPGDFSSAAFLLAAAAVTKSEVTVKNLDYTTKQADKQILGVLKKLGVEGTVCPDSVAINGSAEIFCPIDVDAREIPDLVPICAVLACFAEGVSVIHHARRLRLKESDRLVSIYSELRKLGANVRIEEDSLTVEGPAKLHGAVIDPHNDHRIAMATAVAALCAEGETVIQNAECVRKSYPQFFNDLRLIGADVVGGQFDR